MKKAIIIISSILALTSCARFDDGRVNSVRLLSPEADAYFDLAEGNPSFSWQVSGVLKEGCSLVMAADYRGDVVKSFELIPSDFKKEVESSAIDEVLAQWGYYSRQDATVWWRVEPKDASVTDISAFRPVRFRRLLANPIAIADAAPKNKALVDMNNVNSVEFSWSPVEGVESYALQFRPYTGDAELPVPAACSQIRGTSYTLEAADINNLIADYQPDMPLVSLSWRVVSNTSECPAESEFRQIRFVRLGAEGISPASDVKVFPGSKRAKLSWKVTDPRTEKVVLTCAGNTYDVAVNEEIEDYEYIIESLVEGETEISLVSVDVFGGRSDEVKVKAQIYDADKLADSFTSPVPAVGGLFREGVQIALENATDSRRVSSYVEYISPDGLDTYTMEFEPGSLTTVIPDGEMKLGSEVSLYSRFSPVENALDLVLVKSPETVFVPAYSMVPLENCGHWPNAADNEGILFGDMGNYNASFPFSQLFDGVTTNSLNMWHTTGADNGGKNGYILEHPVVLTLDLQSARHLSSLVVWGRYGGTASKPGRDGGGTASNESYWAYGSYNPRNFEVWGSATAPSDASNAAIWDPMNGSWRTDGSWTKLADCSVQRPSGSTATCFWYDEGCIDDALPTVEDYEAAAHGHEFATDLNAPEVRYIRIVITKTWNYFNRQRISFGELHFYEYTK